VATTRVVRCSSCGASTSPREPRCGYCGSHLIHLSPFERRTTPRATASGKQVWFRSLGPLYKGAAVLAGVIVIALYFVFFNDLSETELVRLSPVWVLLLAFGITGLYTERAVNLILEGKEERFHDALNEGMDAVPPLFMLAIYFVLLPPIMVFGLKRYSSPLLMATVTAAGWGALLYFFLIAIFPML
jgi:hypothetical protein